MSCVIIVSFEHVCIFNVLFFRTLWNNKWNEMKWNEMKWNEMKWKADFTCSFLKVISLMQFDCSTENEILARSTCTHTCTFIFFPQKAWYLTTYICIGFDRLFNNNLIDFPRGKKIGNQIQIGIIPCLFYQVQTSVNLPPEKLTESGHNAQVVIIERFCTLKYHGPFRNIHGNINGSPGENIFSVLKIN